MVRWDGTDGRYSCHQTTIKAGLGCDVRWLAQYGMEVAARILLGSMVAAEVKKTLDCGTD